MGRPAIINSEENKKDEHLKLLNEQEQEYVKLRWGHTTGEPLTRVKAAQHMNLGVEQARKMEAKIVARISEHRVRVSPFIESKPNHLGVFLTDVEYSAVDRFAYKKRLTPSEITRDAVLRTVMGRRKFRKHVKARK